MEYIRASLTTGQVLHLWLAAVFYRTTNSVVGLTDSNLSVLGNSCQVILCCTYPVFLTLDQTLCGAVLSCESQGFCHFFCEKYWSHPLQIRK